MPASPQLIGTYDSYESAMGALRYLVGQGIDEAGLTVVGRDLRPAGESAAKWGKIALNGAVSGVMWGLLVTVLLWLFLPGHSLWLFVLCGIGFGVIYGALAQVVQHFLAQASQAGGRTVSATWFDVICAPEQADRAVWLINNPPAAAAPEPEPGPSQPDEPDVEVLAQPSAHPRRAVLVDESSVGEKPEAPSHGLSEPEASGSGGAGKGLFDAFWRQPLVDTLDHADIAAVTVEDQSANSVMGDRPSTDSFWPDEADAPNHDQDEAVEVIDM